MMRSHDFYDFTFSLELNELKKSPLRTGEAASVLRNAHPVTFRRESANCNFGINDMGLGPLLITEILNLDNSIGSLRQNVSHFEASFERILR